MNPEDDLCACGHPALKQFSINYKYPRAEYLAEAMDPYYAHGGDGHIWTCGNPQCEPSAFLAARERVIDHHVLVPRPWMPCGLSAGQMTGLEVELKVSA